MDLTTYSVTKPQHNIKFTPNFVRGFSIYIIETLSGVFYIFEIYIRIIRKFLTI